MQTSVGNPVVVAVYQLKIGFRDFWVDFLEIVSIFACSPVLWTMENVAKMIVCFFTCDESLSSGILGFGGCVGGGRFGVLG